MECKLNQILKGYERQLKGMGRLVDIEHVIKAVDKHTKDESEVVLDEDITVILEEVPTACNDNGWISCSKDLPKERIDVLVWNSDQDMCCVAWYNSVTKIWYSNDFEIADSKYVVAWQPLPEPYEE